MNPIEMRQKEMLSAYLNNDSVKICRCADLIYETFTGEVKKHDNPKHALDYIIDVYNHSGYNPTPLIQIVKEEEA